MVYQTKMFILCAVIFAPLYSLSVFAQTESPLERAKDYIENAEAYYVKGLYELSIREYRFSGRIYRETSHPEKYGICYNGIGSNYIDLTRYKEAFQEFNRVLTTFDDLRKEQPDLEIDSLIIADAYEGLGRFHMNVNANFDTALYYHQEALAIRLALLGENAQKTARSYYFLGSCYGNLSLDSTDWVDTKYANSVEARFGYLKKALIIQKKVLKEDHPDIADTYEAFGYYYYEVDHDYHKGFDFQEWAWAIRQNLLDKNHPKIASSYTAQAVYYRALQDYDKELGLLEKALMIQLEMLGKEHKDIAKNYYLLGNRYRASGEYEKAQTFYKNALGIYTKLQGEQSLEIAEVCHEMGLAFRDLKNKYLEFEYLQKALKMRQKMLGKQHQKVGESYLEIGTYYSGRKTNGGYDSLIVYYTKALKIWENQLNENHYLIAKAYDGFAKAYEFKGEIEKSFEYLNQALLKKKNQGKEPNNAWSEMAVSTNLEKAKNKRLSYDYQLFDSYFNLSKYYSNRKNYYLGAVHAQNAISAVAKSLSLDDIDIYKNPKIEELAHDISWVQAVQQKADMLLLRYLEANTRVDDLEFSLKTYQFAIDLIDNLRMNFSSDGAKQRLTDHSIPIYEGSLRALFLLHEKTGDLKYLDLAFEVMERSKAFVLLQALRNVKAKGFGGVPAALLLEEESLRHSVAYYSTIQHKGGDYPQIYLEKKLMHDSLIKVLETQYPKYHELKYQNMMIGIKDVRKGILRENDAMLEYFFGDKELFVFFIDQDKVRLYREKIPKDYILKVANFRSSMTDYKMITEKPQKAYDHFVEVAFDIQETFLAPFIKDLNAKTERLILIPDGLLSYIPFEVLLLEKPSTRLINYKDLDYLMKNHVLNYGYSATLLLKNMEPKKFHNNGQCLGFAPSYKEEGNAEINTNLPWAEKELKIVESVFSGNYFYGEKATKDVFQGQANEFAIIHLAMHGAVDFKNSLRSKLAFAQLGEETVDDDFLYAFEVHSMQINAQLVVLSACETGFGQVVRGEGVLSLARAFMYAGTPSVITTLWKVNDYTSSILMEHFYRNLSNGYSRAEALHLAKLSYLSNSDKVSGHPAFWASFVAIGDPSFMRLPWPWWYWALFFIGLISLLVGGVWAFLRRKNAKKTDTTLSETTLKKEEEKKELMDKLEPKEKTREEITNTLEEELENENEKTEENI